MEKGGEGREGWRGMRERGGEEGEGEGGEGRGGWGGERRVREQKRDQ